MDRRNFMTRSAAVAAAAVTTNPLLAAAQYQPATSNPQRQPASFGQAGRDFPKVGGNLANQNYSTL